MSYISRKSSVTNTVSLNLAIGLLVMMYPILCKVRYETLHQTFRSKQLWIQVGFSVFVNWIVAPFLMVSLSAKRSSDIANLL